MFARQQRWGLAAALVAGAAFTRVHGVLLGVALIVEYVALTWRTKGFVRIFRPAVFWLVLPFVSAFSFVVYLRLRTGHWDAYQRAQEAGWGRHTASVVEGFRTVWNAATNGDQAGQYAWSWRAEMIAVLSGFVLCVVLLCLQRFGEATYVGLSAFLLAAQNYYASSVRSAMIWFPLYLLLARMTYRRDWLHYALLALSAPLMAVFVLTFTRGGWVG